MDRVARAILVLYVFTIPWEYSLDLGAPFGNIARIAGLLLLLVTGTSLIVRGGFRKVSLLHWIILALYIWLCCTYFWSVTPDATLVKLRGYFQEMMVVWLAWELVETPADLRRLCRAWVAGSWVLAALTLADFITADPTSGEQLRFVAIGQDPNDVARFLDLAFPVAALLVDGKESRIGRVLSLGYFPLGMLAVVLTASRSGFVTAAIAIAGSAALVALRQPRIAMSGAFAAPAFAAAAWMVAPADTIGRLGTILEQVRGGDLNQRMNIWSAGWQAFVQAPLWGHGAGSFVTASGLAAIDTAHNTVLATVVEGGIAALAIATAIVFLSIRSIAAMNAPLRMAFGTAVAVWLVSSLVGTVGESRITWLLFAVIAVAERLAVESSQAFHREFPVRINRGLCDGGKQPE